MYKYHIDIGQKDDVKRSGQQSTTLAHAKYDGTLFFPLLSATESWLTETKAQALHSRSRLWRRAVLTFESVDKILWCDHSNETSLAVLLYGTIFFCSVLQNEIWHFSWILSFGTKYEMLTRGASTREEKLSVNHPSLAAQYFSFYLEKLL